LNLGADLAAAEPARVLRLPNTRNYRYEPPRLVTVERFEPDRRYSLSEFDDWLAPDRSVIARAAEPEVGPILAGRRNASLTSLAGTMRRRGMSEEAILAALQIDNATRCQTPLPDGELRRIATSVARYPPNSNAAGPLLALKVTTLSDLFAKPEEDTQWLVVNRIPIGG